MTVARKSDVGRTRLVSCWLSKPVRVLLLDLALRVVGLQLLLAKPFVAVLSERCRCHGEGGGQNSGNYEETHDLSSITERFLLKKRSDR
jgi:hypothetical protein